MDDQLSDAELEKAWTTLKEILRELARQAAWDDHQKSLRVKKTRKRILQPKLKH